MKQMSDPKSPDSTIITALRIIARDLDSEDGVPNLALLEAANRVQELVAENKLLHDRIEELEAEKDNWPEE